MNGMVRNIMIVVSVLSTNARLGETETERQRVQKKQKSKRNGGPLFWQQKNKRKKRGGGCDT